MFLDIGFAELMLIAVVGLLVIGPDRLPQTLRDIGLWMGRLRRSFAAVKTEIEKEIGMDEVRRQLHNEAVMEEMKRIEAAVKNTVDEAKISAETIDPTLMDPNLDETAEEAEAEPTTTSSAEDDQAASGMPEPVKEPDAASYLTPELTPDVTPRSEAELEMLHEMKSRAKKSTSVKD